VGIVLGWINDMPVVLGCGVVEKIDVGFLEDDDVLFCCFWAVEEGLLRY
jgi:hypothetical protein